ncbi:choice-of-anchor Q domain-containing protein [Oceanithermus profundus]|uniref:Uncharacterized protein n=1 Tax=Oceanithermus profundus (strain DSM 14977 / NBRC 100410 / VKM B-2274 / 506) TaxID=670487 RepID=E4U5X7_OCEP5|nr:choice-of-anchor Q domain-containing protein [Oceanithermus profundus]ADR35798.1 hypothetical protein Ocepr_0338 [Oceanithermus profundus DSM 14977]
MIARIRMAPLLALALLVACDPAARTPPGPGGGSPPESGAFEPPIGIPPPEFGIVEKLEDYYTRPDPWDEETPGWYYVQHDHPSASDARIYGTPAAPRATIPDPIPAGSVVVLAGAYAFAPTGYDSILAEGTAEAPVFIVGEEGAVVTRKWRIQSTYLIVDGLEFTGGGRIEIRYPSHHVAFRNGEHHNTVGKFGGGGASPAEYIHDIVIYNNKIHSQEGWNEGTEDKDNHGIKFGPYTEDVWILDNVGYHNAGDFIQVGDWGDGSTEALNRARRFYIGRNVAYANRQSALGIKQATDVIVSQNVFYDNKKIQSNVGGQAGIYFLYGPERIWLIYNRIYDSNSGITGGSNSGGTGQEQYLIGNVIYDIAAAPDDDKPPGSAWGAAAIRLNGGQNRYVVDNTIWNVDGGIYSPSNRPLYVHGNVVAGVRGGHHLVIDTKEGANLSRIEGNLFFQPEGSPTFRMGSSTVYTGVSAFEAAWPARVRHNLEADPRFTDITARDFRPQSGSPAIDSGSEHDVYQRFFDLYGLDIRRDAAGTPRPQGAAWDRGAYERPQ